jgi:hypothetical protein
MKMSTDVGLKAVYTDLMEKVEEIDVKLDSLTDTEAAGKRKIGNDLQEAAKPSWSNVVDQLVPQLKSLAPEELAGVYLGITRTLRSEFDESVSKFIAETAESAPKSEPLISEDEAKELQTFRSEAYQQLKSLVDIIKTMMGEELPMPKTRRGARGKRGKRALSLYTWAVNGEAVSDDDDSVAGVAKLLGFEKAKDFTEALRAGGIPAVEANKVDTRNPNPTFEVTINDKIVSAERTEEVSEEEESEEEASEEE